MNLWFWWSKVKSQGPGDLTKQIFALWAWYLQNALREALQIWHERLLSLTEEVIRICQSKVKC